MTWTIPRRRLRPINRNGKRTMPKKDPTPWWPRAALTVLSLAAAISVVVLLRDLVERRYAWPPTAPRVVLLNRPQWMSAALAEQIVDTARPVGIRSVFDRQLLVDTATAL